MPRGSEASAYVATYAKQILTQLAMEEDSRQLHKFDIPHPRPLPLDRES